MHGFLSFPPKCLAAEPESLTQHYPQVKNYHAWVKSCIHIVNLSVGTLRSDESNYMFLLHQKPVLSYVIN